MSNPDNPSQGPAPSEPSPAGGTPIKGEPTVLVQKGLKPSGYQTTNAGISGEPPTRVQEGGVSAEPTRSVTLDE